MMTRSGSTMRSSRAASSYSGCASSAGLQGVQDLGGGLDELGLLGVFRLDLLDDALSVSHCVNLLADAVLC